MVIPPGQHLIVELGNRVPTRGQLQVTAEDVANIPVIQQLDLRDNKIRVLPDEIVNLQALERLDVTNNDLATLPYTVGTLPHMKSLLVEGNPMKSIRRDIIQRGTVGLMKYLRSRLTEEELVSLRDKGNASPVPVGGAGGSSSPVPDKYTMKTSCAMAMSKKELARLPDEAVENAKAALVTSVDLSKNAFAAVPENLREIMPEMTELNMSANRIESLPGWIGELGANLQYLNFGNNKLASVPSELSRCPNLREVALPYNRLTEIPECLYQCEKLETLILCGNQIAEIDVPGLKRLERLAILDLQNNNIANVPAELGLMTQLRALSLEGNAFRVPRPQIMVKGTEAILSYLRDRIPK